MKPQFIKVNKVLLTSKEDAGLSNLIARLSVKHINRFVKRREAIIICNPKNGSKIVRYALGGGGISGLNSTSICIDYDGIETLGLKYSKEIDCELVIRKPYPFESYFMFMAHPDLSIRLPMRLGMLGAGLGIISFIHSFV